MPELPEVQTTVNGLRRSVVGLRVLGAWTDYGSPFHCGKDSIKDAPYFARFAERVAGATIVSVDRVAKNILIRIENGGARSVILIHMKMTGHLLVGRFIWDGPARRWRPAPGERPSLSDPYNRFVHFALSLSDGRTLALSDARKFAKVTLIDEADIPTSVHLDKIGPDPLSKGFSLEAFMARMSLRPNGPVKQVLMDQKTLAGVGNIYSDEALWRAGIHPKERVRDVPASLMKKLFSSLLAVLTSGIDFGGDSMSDYRNIHGERGRFQEHHMVYRRTGERCLRPGCPGTIVRMKVGGRSAHFCDAHQRRINGPTGGRGIPRRLRRR